MELGKSYQFSRLKIISKPYRLGYPSLKSPLPPLCKGGAGGISGESFQKVKVIFFKELKCYGKSRWGLRITSISI
jgi:hypothetical protein